MNLADFKPKPLIRAIRYEQLRSDKPPYYSSPPSPSRTSSSIAFYKFIDT